MGTGEKIQSLLVLCSGKVETRMEGEENRELVLDHLKAPCVLAPAFLFASDNSAPMEKLLSGKNVKNFMIAKKNR